MSITVYRKPCLLLEAEELVYCLVNHIPSEQMSGEGAFCIPADVMEQIRQKACAGLSPQDPALQFYFQGIPMEGRKGRPPCLASFLLYSRLQLGTHRPEETLQVLSRAWAETPRPFRVTDLNGFSIELSTAPAPEEFLPLSQEIGKLPIPASAQLQIVEVLSVPQEHLQRLSAFLLPVAEELEVQLAPWVARAQPLADAWENFFRTVSIDTFTQQRYHVKQSAFCGLHLALRYISPDCSFLVIRDPPGEVHLYASVKMEVGMGEAGESDAFGKDEFMLFRLLSNETRMAMLRLLMQEELCFQDIVSTMKLNPGTVFRELNSMREYMLIQINIIDGKQYSKANKDTIKNIANKLIRFAN